MLETAKSEARLVLRSIADMEAATRFLACVTLLRNAYETHGRGTHPREAMAVRLAPCAQHERATVHQGELQAEGGRQQRRLRSAWRGIWNLPLSAAGPALKQRGRCRCPAIFLVYRNRPSHSSPVLSLRRRREGKAGFVGRGKKRGASPSPHQSPLPVTPMLGSGNQ